MKRLGSSAVAAAFATFVLLGFADFLPPTLQSLLAFLSIATAALLGENVHAGSARGLAGSAFFILLLGALASQACWARLRVPAPPDRLRRWGLFAAELALFAAAFRLAAGAARSDPFRSSLIPYAALFLGAGLLSGAASGRARPTLAALLSGFALGISFDWVQLATSVELREALRFRGAWLGYVHAEALSYLAGVFSGLAGWLAARGVALAARAFGGPAPPRGAGTRGLEVKPGRRPPARGWRLAALLLLLAAGGGLYAALAVRPLPRQAPGAGASRYDDRLLFQILAPDRPIAWATLSVDKDGRAYYAAQLSESPPRGYLDSYVRLIARRGLFVEALAGSGHSPRPLHSYRFLAIARTTDRRGGTALKHKTFWERQDPDPLSGDPFWLPLRLLQTYPSPFALAGRLLSIRLGDAASSPWRETSLLPAEDDYEAREFPFARFPGSVLRGWGPEVEDRELRASDPRASVQRIYVVRRAAPDEILGHFSQALAGLGRTVEPRRSQRELEWIAQPAIAGLARVRVSVGDLGLAWGEALHAEHHREAARALLPELGEAAQVRVDVSFASAADAVAHWPAHHVLRRRLLHESNGGREARAAGPAVPDPKIAVLECGYARSAVELLSWQLGHSVRAVGASRVSAGLLAEHRVLVIPSGGLRGPAKTPAFREGLARFVARGGVVIALAQEQGDDFQSLPTPAGQRLRAIGWVSDQSVYHDAARVDRWHPALASLASEHVSGAFDGFFEETPAQAQVLLRKARNLKPVLIAYPVGSGWVIATTNYDDCSDCDKKVGRGHPELLRDLASWAEQPEAPPVVAPGETLPLALALRNTTASEVEAARLLLHLPGRPRPLVTGTVRVAIPPPSERRVDWPVSPPADAPLGVYRVEYELLDASGASLDGRLRASVRLAVARPSLTAGTPGGDVLLSVLMPRGETIIEGASAPIEFRLVNRAPAKRRFRVYWNLTQTEPRLVREAELAAGAELRTGIVAKPKLGDTGVWIQVFEPGGRPRGRPRFAVPGETGAIVIFEGKGIRVEPRR